MPHLQHPPLVEQALLAIPGVVGTGLFLGMAETVLIATPRGVEVRRAAEVVGMRRVGCYKIRLQVKKTRCERSGDFRSDRGGFPTAKRLNNLAQGERSDALGWRVRKKDEP